MYQISHDDKFKGRFGPRDRIPLFEYRSSIDIGCRCCNTMFTPSLGTQLQRNTHEKLKFGGGVERLHPCGATPPGTSGILIIAGPVRSE